MAEQFEFWISDTRLPVTPGELSISNGVNIEKVDLANGNKFTRFVGKELATISFTASFPTVNQNRNRPHYAFSDISDPLYYWNKFRNLMVNGTPFQLIIIRKPNVNRAIGGWYLINSMDEKYSADKGSEMEISFELIRYVAPTTVRVVEIPQINDVTIGELVGVRPSNLNIPEYVTTSFGTSFQTLAFSFYNNVNYADFIRSLNPNLSNRRLTESLPIGISVRLRENQND